MEFYGVSREIYGSKGMSNLELIPLFFVTKVFYDVITVSFFNIHSNSFQVFGFVSLSMVLVSTAGFILSTLPQFQQDGEYFALSAIFVIIDQIAVYFFTFEYAIRLLCAPRKFRFVLRQVFA